MVYYARLFFFLFRGMSAKGKGQKEACTWRGDLSARVLVLARRGDVSERKVPHGSCSHCFFPSLALSLVIVSISVTVSVSVTSGSACLSGRHLSSVCHHVPITYTGCPRRSIRFSSDGPSKTRAFQATPEGHACTTCKFPAPSNRPMYRRSTRDINNAIVPWCWARPHVLPHTPRHLGSAYNRQLCRTRKGHHLYAVTGRSTRPLYPRFRGTQLQRHGLKGLHPFLSRLLSPSQSVLLVSVSLACTTPKVQSLPTRIVFPVGLFLSATLQCLFQ